MISLACKRISIPFSITSVDSSKTLFVDAGSPRSSIIRKISQSLARINLDKDESAEQSDNSAIGKAGALTGGGRVGGCLQNDGF